MVVQQPDCQLSLVYIVLQAACRFKLPAIRQAAVRWLRQNNRRPTGELLFRLKLADLQEACSQHVGWNKSIDRIVDLFDFITPKDPEQTCYNSPWFYFRNYIIVTAAIEGYDDTICLDSCNKHLLRMPFTEPGSADYKKKREYLSKVVKELTSYNGAIENKTVMKKNYPLILQYCQKNSLVKLQHFLEKIHSTLDPNFCFLESAIENLPDWQDPNAAVELPSDTERLGLKLLLEQFEDVESSLRESLRAAQEPPVERSNVADHTDDGSEDLPSRTVSGKSFKRRPNRGHPSSKQLESETESGELPQKGRKRHFDDMQSSRQRAGRDHYRDGNKSIRKSSGAGERLEAFQKRWRSMHRAVERVPDARQRAIETARRIQEALDQGVYERWSDNEDEQGYHSPDTPSARAAESRSPSPRPAQGVRSAGSHKKPAPSSSSRPEPGKVRRRSVGQWQQYEIEELRSGVAEFGVGQWSKILRNGRFLPGRTSVDLKDKYRNMVKRNLFQCR